MALLFHGAYCKITGFGWHIIRSHSRNSNVPDNKDYRLFVDLHYFQNKEMADKNKPVYRANNVWILGETIDLPFNKSIDHVLSYAYNHIKSLPKYSVAEDV